MPPKPPSYGAPQWDLLVFLLGLCGLGVAFALRQAALAVVVGALVLVVLKLRLAGIDRWNATRAFGDRVGAGSKLNHFFAVTMLVWAAWLTFYLLRVR